MIHSKSIAAAVAIFVATPLHAGVEMDLVTQNAAGVTTETMKIFAQSGKIRMDDAGEASGESMSMIYVDQQFIVISHSDQSYLVIDEAMMAQMGSQINAAMEQMQAQLADMPPEQAAMLEQMMQGQMPGLMGAAEEPPPPTVQVIGTGEWQSEPCTQYAVFEGAEKTQEICATPLDDIDGSDEVMQAFEDMASFLIQLSQSMPEPMASSMAENPMGMMGEIDGFPVRTVNFVSGEAHSETTLEDYVERSLDDNLFSVPTDYTQQNLFDVQ